MPSAPTETFSALAALRGSDPDVRIGALISAGTGPWSRRSVVAELGRRIAVETAADLPNFFNDLGPRGGGDPGAGWLGYFGYGLGALLEPAAGRSAGGGVAAELWRVGAGEIAGGFDGGGYLVGPLTSAVGAHGFWVGVERALGFISAGDVYQVNLTHMLCAPFCGSSRGLAADAIEKTGAWYGAYLETGNGAIVSTSPELLVRVTADGRIVSRPMKGTRRAGDAAGLAKSAKDAAELAMIVDLMRNDLGRVCELGSVRVESGREIEPHAGVEQGVATVTGLVRGSATWEEIVRAVFPAGSITGAPKIRAMQIIDELEVEPRGVYCGSIVWIGDDGSMDMNVAIRTAVVVGGELRFGVGAGIVADSEAGAEWRETLDKAAGFAWAVGTVVSGLA